MPLPVSHQVGADTLAKREASQASHLIAVADAAVVLAPRSLLSVAEKVGACDVVMMASLGAAKQINDE